MAHWFLTSRICPFPPYLPLLGLKCPPGRYAPNERRRGEENLIVNDVDQESKIAVKFRACKLLSVVFFEVNELIGPHALFSRYRHRLHCPQPSPTYISGDEESAVAAIQQSEASLMSESDYFPSATSVLPVPSPSLTSIWTPEMDRELLKPVVAATFMNCIAYGLYVPMFCWSFHALFFAMKNSPNRRALSWISTILFVLCTTQAFLFNLKVLFLILWHPMNLVFVGALRIFYYISPFVYMGVVYLADGVFIYRLFHVWGRQWWVIVFPMVSMFVAPVFCVTMVITHFMNPYKGFEFLVLLDSFVTNLYITSMISFKIWQNNRNVRHLGSSGLTSIIPLLLESAGVYTVFSAIIAFCKISFVPDFLWRLFEEGSLEMLTSVAGTAYSLMIILVARGRSRSGDIKSTAMTSLNFCVAYDLQDLEAAAQSSEETALRDM